MSCCLWCQQLANRWHCAFMQRVYLRDQDWSKHRSFSNNINNYREKRIHCSMNAVMMFELTQRDLAVHVITTPRLMNTKWIHAKLLKNRQGLEPSSTLHISQYALCRCVDRMDTDIKTISSMQQLCVLPQRLAPVSQLFNSSNAG